MKDKIFYKIVRRIVIVFLFLFFRPKIIGKNSIPKNGKIILAGNHISIFDPLVVIYATKRQVHFLAKSELFVGFKKIIFNNLGLIPVNRKIKDKNVLPLSKKYLEDGKVIGIFPEGTTKKRENQLFKFKIGAVKLSKDTNTYIIPFKIFGKYKLFRRITIKFTSPFLASEDLNKTNEFLYDIINNMKVDD